MNYKMKVTVNNPQAMKVHEKKYILNCAFPSGKISLENSDCFLIISGAGFEEKIVRIPVSIMNSITKQINFLCEWSCKYWSGENGAYKLTAISVERVKG